MLDEEVVTLVKRYLPEIWDKYKDRITDTSILGS